MGSSLDVVLDNYIGSAPIPCHLQLGPSTSIDLSKDFEKDDAEVVKETFKVVYTVDKETCVVSFTRDVVDQDSKSQEIRFFVQDRISSSQFYWGYSMTIDKANSFWMQSHRYAIPHFKIWAKTNESFDAWGGVVDTTVHLYGSGGRSGLLVLEIKKKRGEIEPSVVTFAHYFVRSSGTSFDRSSGTDIGLSLVAKCRISNGKFDTTVEGPEQHPVSALLYMFDQVYKTRSWKPTMCPHCDHKRKGKVFWQSDSEDSDSVSIPVPVATPKSARGVSNGGRFKGNGNGNFFENVMIFPKRR